MSWVGLGYGQFGSVWLSVGWCIWSNMAWCGSVWLSVGQYGSVWLSVVGFSLVEFDSDELS